MESADRASIVARYSLEKHVEGGWFSDFYTAPTLLGSSERSAAGSIYFLLDGAELSKFHRIDCDEIWYFHQGVGMNIYFVEKDNTVSVRQLGIGPGQQPAIVIPKGIIFGADNIDSTGYTFISCATVPHFTYHGFELITKTQCPPLPSTYDKFFSSEDKLHEVSALRGKE